MKSREAALVAGLSRAGLKLSLAESCTGGLVSARLTDVPGCSATLLMGLVVYSNESKSRLLGVPAKLLEQFGAVSAEVARSMAEGVLMVSGSDIGVAVTGIAGPDGGTAEKPVGTVFVAIADKHGCEVARHLFKGDRAMVRNMTVEAVFDRLEQKLEQHRKQAK